MSIPGLFGKDTRPLGVVSTLGGGDVRRFRISARLHSPAASVSVVSTQSLTRGRSNFKVDRSPAEEGEGEGGVTPARRKRRAGSNPERLLRNNRRRGISRTGRATWNGRFPDSCNRQINVRLSPCVRPRI